MEETKKIRLIIDTLIFGLQKRGGISTYWYEMLKRMIHDDDIELTIIKIKGEYKNTVIRDLDFSKCKILYESTPILQLQRNLAPSIPKQKDIAIFHSTQLRVASTKNVKNVVTVHDFTHQKYFHGLKKWLNTFQKYKSINNASMVICVSENTKKDLIAYYPDIDKNKLAVVYNGAGEEYHRLDGPTLPESYNEISDKKYIIYVGDRFPYKNTKFLFDVLKNDKSLHLVLIGGFDFTPEEKTLKSELLDDDGKSRVHRFTGVSNTDLNILYNLAHALVYPSYYEGFGIPILEAMQAGCPVITFNNSSLPEVLNGSGILLETNDLEGCTEAINRLSNQEYREDIILKQMEASKKFSWDNAYSELKKIYKKVMEEK